MTRKVLPLLWKEVNANGIPSGKKRQTAWHLPENAV